jgi:hypothetical protein
MERRTQPKRQRRLRPRSSHRTLLSAWTPIRDELRKAGFMTDQERRAEIEKLLAPIKVGRALNLACRRHRKSNQSCAPPPATSPSPEPAEHESAPSPLGPTRLDLEEAARAKEQVRLQAAYEQAEKVKAAGRNRVRWVPRPAKPIDHAGPHYAPPDGRPYGSSRPRGG